MAANDSNSKEPEIVKCELIREEVLDIMIQDPKSYNKLRNRQSDKTKNSESIIFFNFNSFSDQEF